jgi:2,4-dienoyl-CoA reductase-like NADH-dependent reductase (Old Yellow Enzyme family)
MPERYIPARFLCRLYKYKKSLLMAMLFDPLTIRDIRFKNRITVSPMCEYSSIDGFANDWHLVHLGSRAVGGAGLVITEAMAVSPEGRITPSDLGIWKDEHLPYLQRINEFIAAQGAVPGVQLAHAGRKASHHVPWKGGQALASNEGAWQTLAPCATPFHAGEPPPKEMTTADIEKVKKDFSMAARRALQVGFKVIEIHAAHGYLLNEFLSPLTNQRTDAYGGTFENRARLLVEITGATRQLIGDTLPLFVRISATDWVEGGFTIEDAVQLALLLKDKGADLIDCSSGGNSPDQKIPVGPMYQVGFAERIKNEAGILTGAVGLITKATEAEQILEDGKADLIILARQLLRDPYFPLHAAKELGIDVPWPVQYERAKK